MNVRRRRVGFVNEGMVWGARRVQEIEIPTGELAELLQVLDNLCEGRSSGWVPLPACTHHVPEPGLPPRVHDGDRWT